jgi:ribosomal protein L30/L7E
MGQKCDRENPRSESLRGVVCTRLQQTLTLPDRPEIRGMIDCVKHLLEVKKES